ncbi:sulfotransferase, partial [bacterium]|nr:sulfotransferase [bacterium]
MEWIDNPIFLCGHRKSGTTLLLSLFDDHPNLNVFPPDSGFWYGYYPRYESDQFSDQEKCQRAINVMIENFKSDLENLDSWKKDQKKFDLNEFINKFKESLPSKDIHPKDVLDSLMKSFFEISKFENNKVAWMEKTTSTEIYALEAAKWYKNAKFIHLIRDPRDNFASLKSGWEDRYVDQNDSPERLLQSLLDRGLYGLKLASTNQEVLGNDRYKVIKYED